MIRLPGHKVLPTTCWLALLFFTYGYWYPSFQNIVEVPVLISLSDSSYFANDFYVQEMKGFGPRSFYYGFILILTDLGLPLPYAFFLAYTGAFMLFVSGLWKLTCAVNRHPLSFPFLVTTVLFVQHGNIGLSFVFKPEPIPSVLAVGFSLFGIAFFLSGQEKKGTIFFLLAALFQFLIGFLPFLLIAPVYLLIHGKNMRRRRVVSTIVLAVCGFGANYLPMYISGYTSGRQLSGHEFVSLYAHIRHPHHIILSTFSRGAYIEYFTYLLSGLLSYSLMKGGSQPKLKTLFFALPFSLALLAVGFFLVEIIPVPLIAKLQLARLTPFVKLLASIIVAALVAENFIQRRYFLVASLVLCAFCEGSSFPLLILLLGLKSIAFLKQGPRSKVFIEALLPFTCAALAFFLDGGGSLSPHIKFSMPLKIMTFVVGCFFLFEHGKVVSRMRNVVAALMLALLGLTLLEPSLVPFIQRIAISRVKVNYSSYYAGFEATSIAMKLRHLTPTDAVVLTPPSRFEFKAFSGRAVVFDFLAFPYSDRGIEEWGRRLRSILSVDDLSAWHPPSPQRALEEAYRLKAPQELLNLARKYNATFIMVERQSANELLGKKLVDGKDWVVYQVEG